MTKLLDPDEPAPVHVANAAGGSMFLILCDHAGARLPRRLGTLGLSATDRTRHIAWDIGAHGVCDALGRLLEATVIEQTYSRLVIDCNRALDHPTSIVTLSEATEVPGNRDLSAADRAARAAEIFQPYHAAITRTLDARAAAGRPTVVIAMHSFTPVFHGVARPWQAGMLYNHDPRFARRLGDLLRQEGFTVGDNEPYRLSDTSDYTIPVHAEQRGLPHAEIELRQDLIAEPAGQQEWAKRLARLLPAAWAALRE
jgi:predicted N-formylglutamate amidohydrolase